MRVAAKELTSLVLDEERLRAERSDRKSWKSRVTGLEEYGPQGAEPSSSRRMPPRERRVGPTNEEEDAEYRLALEASKYQEEEDRKRRESRQGGGGGGGAGGEDDDDLAKAIKLSKEEDERRRQQEQESTANATSLFDDDLIQMNQPSQQPQPTGFNQGYQQGNQVDFFANPVDQNQMQNQQTGYMNNAYTGFQQPQQQTGYQTGYNGGFGMQPQMQTGYGNDVFGQQQQQQQQQPFQPQPTGYNPYYNQQQQQQVQSPTSPEQAGSNNPWATNNSLQQPQSIQPTPTGSNNPFAQFNRSQSAKPTLGSLGSLPEQKSLSAFGNQQQQQQPQPLQHSQSFGQPQTQPAFGTPQKELNEHESKLNSLLAGGDGMDTFGNTGNLRIPSQHTAPGTFVNSAGAGAARLNPEATGNNPFMRQQFTGMPAMNYSQPNATGPAGMNGQMNNNPFGQQQPQQQKQNQDLIQF